MILQTQNNVLKVTKFPNIFFFLLKKAIFMIGHLEILKAYMATRYLMNHGPSVFYSKFIKLDVQVTSKDVQKRLRNLKV